MEAFQITAPEILATDKKTETFDSVDSVKVKITATLFMQEDFVTFAGDPRVEYPIVPGRVAVGKVCDIGGNDSLGIERGTDVVLHPVANCGKCFECTEGDYKHCSDFKIAGKNTDGFLKDFAVVNYRDMSILPSAVGENEALFIEHVAASDRIVDAINLERGEHVVIVGGDVLSIILAQLIIYYQGVPILVDNNLKNLELAKSAGVYYTLFADNKIEKSVAALTGARMAGKVVYITGSSFNTDIALRLAGHNACVCFAGFGAPNIKVNFNHALIKNLNFNCVTNGFGKYASAINLLANKAIDTSVFTLTHVKQSNVEKTIREMNKTVSFDACEKMMVVDWDKL